MSRKENDVFWGMSEQEKREIFSMAFEAMKKQVPKEPLKDCRDRNICGNEDCKEIIFRYFEYCPECGQKINWEAQNEAAK